MIAYLAQVVTYTRDDYGLGCRLVPAGVLCKGCRRQLRRYLANAGDPRFYQTVIMLVRHDRSGAMGIVVNRPLQERPLAALLEALGEKADGAAGNVRIFAGGPVQPELGFVLHSAEYRRADTMEIDGHLAMTSSREILRDIANNRGPKQSLVAFGYAGWAPGQLEGELVQGVWFTAPADAKLIFEEERERVWDNAITRRTQDL
jgi:putative transcriptional regulator